MLSGLDGIMALAAASGEDLGTTSDIVTDALTAFGESAGESGRLADIMATASSNANTNVSMMGETFKYAAPVAGALGYSMEDTAVAIGLMANAGIKASQAGTSLRAGLTNLVRPVGDAAQKMTEYGISVTDTDGKMLSFHDLMVQLREKLGGLSESEQAAAVSAIFGKNAMSGWLAIINGSDEDFDKLTKAVDNSAGSAERMAEQMNDNLQGKLTLLNSAIEGFGVALYNYFSGPLQDVVGLATDFINGLTGLITPHKTELESFIDGIELSNKEVEKSIEHAKSTVSNAESRVAELSAYKDEIGEVLTKCDNFNKIDLGDGYYKIVDSTGRVVEEGFEPLGTSVTDTEDIIKKFGSGGLSTDKIKEGTDTIAEFFDADGKKIGETKTTLDEFGKAKIDTTNIDDGTQVVISCFNDAGEKVTDFKTSVSGDDLEFHTDGITSGIDTAVEYIGHVSTEVDDVESRLKNFASEGIDTTKVSEGKEAIVQIFDDTGVEIGKFTQTVQSSGDVEITKTGIETGTAAIVKLYNDAGEVVDTFETNVGESGNVEITTEGVAEGTTAIVECYTDAGEKIGEFKSDVQESGNVTVNVTGVETGTTAMITAYNNASESVETFRGKVEESGQSFDTTGVTDSFTKVEDSIKTTYTITDEFTKSKINTMIETMGSTVSGLAEAWNSQTGELTASKEELEKWFDTAKEVAMYEALESAIQELYSAWGESAVTAAKAESALSEAQSKLNELVEERNSLTADEIDRYNILTTAIDVQNGVVKDAQTELDKANKLEQEATQHLENTAASLQEKKEKLGEVINAEKENKKTAEEAAAATEKVNSANGEVVESTENVIDATDKLTKKQQEAIDSYSELFGITEESFRQIAEQWTGTKEEFADWCADQEDKLEDLRKAYENAFSKLSGSIQGYVTTLDAADEAGGKSLENMLQKMQTHMEEMRRWGDNMEYLGQQIGEGFSQEMYDAIVAEGPEKSAETVQMLVDALRSQNPAVREIALETGRVYTENIHDADGIAKVVLDFASDGVALSSALDRGFVDGSKHFNDTVVEVAKSGANAAEQAASGFGTAGEKAGQEEAQGLRNEELGVKQASEAVVNAAKSAAETATQNFERVGEVSMTYLTRGMSNRSTYPSDKVKEIVNSAKQEADVKAADFQNTGQAIVNSIANGVNQNSGYYSSLWNAVSTAVNNAKSAVDNAAQQMSGAGQSMMNALANGISQYGYLAWNAGDSVGNQARNSLNWHINTFEGAGQEMDYGLAQGLVDKASYVSETAANVAWNAFIAAKNRLGIHSPSKEFELLGAQSDEGLANGFVNNQSVVLDAAEGTVQAVLDAGEKEAQNSVRTGELLATGIATGFTAKKDETADEIFKSLEAALTDVSDRVEIPSYDSGIWAAEDFANGFADSKDKAAGEIFKSIEDALTDVSGMAEVPSYDAGARMSKGVTGGFTDSKGGITEEIFKTLEAALTDVSEKAEAPILDAGEGIAEGMTSGFSENKDAVADELFKSIEEVLTDVSTKTEQPVLDAGENIASGIAKGFAQNKEKTVQEVFDSLQEALTDVSDQAEYPSLDAGESIVSSMVEGVKKSAPEVATLTKEAAQAAIDSAVELITEYNDVGTALGKELSGGISNGVLEAEMEIQKVAGLLSDAKEESSQTGEATRAISKEIKSSSLEAEASLKELERTLTDVSSSFLETGGVTKALGDAIASGSDVVVQSIHKMGGSMKDALSQLPEAFAYMGYQMDVGLSNGIQNGSALAINSAYFVAVKALQEAKNALGIASPSKEFEKIGAYSDEGMAGGFRKNQALVEDAARESARSAMEAAQDELSGSDYYTDLTGKISYAGAEQLNRITNARVETADTASAMRSLTSGMSALREFAESLQNPQSPNVTVMIGGKEFKGYIVKTATEGMSQARQNIMKGAGAWA